MEYNKIRKYDNDVFVLKFPKDKYRIGLTFGDATKLQTVSSVYGKPELDELCAGRINCGFFQWEKKNADGSYAQYMSKHLGGAFDGDDVYRNAVSQNDFHDAYMTKTGELKFTDIRTNEKAAEMDSTSVWNAGISFALIENGQKATYVPPSMQSIHSGRHVRSAVGRDKAGNFYFVVVGNRGVTGNELKQIMLDIGCADAFNCDGGGSSTIKMYDSTLNTPTDGTERAVGTVLCAYEKYDSKDFPTVSIGKNNRSVYAELLQRLLVYLKYGDATDIDGIFGNGTDTMVRKFQKDYGLTVDGIVGQGTWGKLMAIIHGQEENKQEDEFLIFSDHEKFRTWLNSQNVKRNVYTIQQHNTFVPDYSDWATRKDEQSYMRGLKYWGVVDQGWQDAPQHFLVFPNGNIGIGRSLELNPAGIFGQNTNSICIENFGYFDKGFDIMTEEQKDAILYLNACLCIKFNLKPSVNTLIYHHWFDLNTGERKDGAGVTKSCPGTNFFGGNKVEDAKKYFIPQVEKYIRDILGETELYGTGVVTASALNVRSLPVSHGDLVGSLPKGSAVDIYDEIDGWYEISYGSGMAYVYGEYVDFSELKMESDDEFYDVDYEKEYKSLLESYQKLEVDYDKLYEEYMFLLEEFFEKQDEVKNTFSEFLEKVLGVFKRR